MATPTMPAPATPPAVFIPRQRPSSDPIPTAAPAPVERRTVIQPRRPDPHTAEHQRQVARRVYAIETAACGAYEMCRDVAADQIAHRTSTPASTRTPTTEE